MIKYRRQSDGVRDQQSGGQQSIVVHTKNFKLCVLSMNPV